MSASGLADAGGGRGRGRGRAEETIILVESGMKQAQRLVPGRQRRLAFQPQRGGSRLALTLRLRDLRNNGDCACSWDYFTAQGLLVANLNLADGNPRLFFLFRAEILQLSPVPRQHPNKHPECHRYAMSYVGYSSETWPAI